MKEMKSSAFGMTNESCVRHSLRLINILEETMAQSNRLHQSFLENQFQVLSTFSSLTGFLQFEKQAGYEKKEIFSRNQLNEFASGSITECFGPDYEVLNNRKTPRIPNGRLLLIDRVTEISGHRMNITPPASIVTEVDIQLDAWFLQMNSYRGVPLAILMEIALQPCGILSAYLGTSLVIPAENNLFRNLDGWLKLSETPDLGGKTITNRAELIKSVASSGLFIQDYKFELSVDDEVFLSGESSFGYFTQAVMEKQAGLDFGEKHLKMIDKPEMANDYKEISADSLFLKTENNAKSLLDLFDQVWFNPQGGQFGLGVIFGKKSIQGDEWFFENHFFQDPVMPGSLGVEVMTRILGAFIREENQLINMENLSIEFSKDKPLRWKYRGQVLPSNHETYFEVHIKEKDSTGSLTKIMADANFWVDDLRIYSVENVSMILKEGMK